MFGFNITPFKFTFCNINSSKHFFIISELFLKHTSASLTINENASPDVREDLEEISSSLVRDGYNYNHSLEGFDDMPAHFKSSMFGVSLNIPITNGRLNLGTWQGIYLNEHRNYPSLREIVITVWVI